LTEETVTVNSICLELSLPSCIVLLLAVTCQKFLAFWNVTNRVDDHRAADVKTRAIALTAVIYETALLI
jgi:uncharacterized CHY-type Zn-finger protein